MTKQNIAFLFGSGISIKAGMPSTIDLTKKILSCENVIRHTDSRFYITKTEHDPFLYGRFIPQIIKLLEIVENKIALYHYDLDKTSFVDYEEIYYLISEIYNYLLHEIENPGLAPFIEQIYYELKPFLVKKKSSEGRTNFKDVIIESLNYIKDLVIIYLDSTAKNVNYLKFLNGFNQNSNYSKMFIFTLNHDLLLEKYFLDNKIDFEDGFTETNRYKMRYWNPNLIEKSSKKIELYKLHGSINWYRLMTDAGNWYDEKIGISTDGNIDRTEREEGVRQFPADNRPLIIVGSFNKLVQYLSGMYIYMHMQLYTKLPKCQTLIISGYGFQDKGINTRITEWVYTSKENRILIIHPNIYELKATSRGAIANKWNKWVNDGVLKTINARIESVSYERIIEMIE